MVIDMGSDPTELTKRLLEDPSVLKGYQRRSEIIEVARMIRAWRHHAGLTQKALAVRMGMAQSSVARIESMDNASLPNIDTLKRLAKECGARLVVGADWSDGDTEGSSRRRSDGVYVKL